MSSATLLRRCEVDGRLVDVRVEGALVAAVGERLSVRPGDVVVDAAGGALLPGLHDHHLHLAALAAAARSVVLGPPEVGDGAGFEAAVRAAHASLPAGAWLRGVGYHESVAGPLDRDVLDALAPGRPVRVQHRSGAQWVLSTPALAVVGAEEWDDPGVERDAAGRVTGRLTGLDDALRGRVPEVPLDLAAVGRRLASYGVTGVTDATPFTRAADLAVLTAAADAGDLPQRIALTGGPSLDPAGLARAGVERGPVKVVVADHALPALDDLVAAFRAARRQGRPVAVHCVTRVALVLALAAWDEVGSVPGDRVEHGGVIGVDLVPALAEHGLTVVTQPNFVAERGDRYLVEVDPEDVADLYPCRRLLDGGVAVGGGTDAPFGHPDPWRAMRAAVDRTTAGGRPLGLDERVGPERALALFLTPLAAPGGPPRAVVPGAAADLCLLRVGRDEALAVLGSEVVAATWCRGRPAYRDPTLSGG